MDIPQFKDTPAEGEKLSSHAKEFWLSYRDLSTTYIALMEGVAKRMYGDRGTFDSLSSGDVRNIQRIVDSALYGALNRFEAAHPEYRDSNGGLYVRAESLKETIISALQEANHDDGE